MDYKHIFSIVGIVTGKDVDDGYLVSTQGKDYLLFPFGNIYIAYFEEKGKVQTMFLQTDDFQKIVSFTDKGKQFVIHDNGIDIIDSNHNQSSLYVYHNKRDQREDVSNNGVLYFFQYRSDIDTQLELRYEQNIFKDNKYLYPYHTDDPYYVSFKQGVTKSYQFLNFGKSYYRMDFDAFKNKFQFDLATIKDYGLGTVLSHNTISLQQSYSFSRFYRVLLQVGEYVTVTGYPFTKQYREEDIEEMIEQLSFQKKVPDSLIYFYNSKDQNIAEKQAIIDIFLNSEYAIEQQKGLYR